MATEAWFIINDKDECHRPQRYTLPAAERGQASAQDEPYLKVERVSLGLPFAKP